MNILIISNINRPISGSNLEECSSLSLSFTLSILHILKNGPTPASFFVYFRFFQTNNTILQQINVKKCPSSLWRWDLNPQSLEHESSHMTTSPSFAFFISIFLFFLSNILPFTVATIPNALNMLQDRNWLDLNPCHFFICTCGTKWFKIFNVSAKGYYFIINSSRFIKLLTFCLMAAFLVKILSKW